MKLLSFLTIVLAITSCSPTSNRGSSRYDSSFLSQYDVTLLSESSCICKQGSPLTNINASCFSICESKPNTAQETLFIDTFLGSNITLNSSLGSLYNWCRNERQEGNQFISNPNCVLLAENSNGQVTQLEVDLDQSSPNFSVNVQDLSFGETYVVTLLETSSGKSSSSIQVRKESVNSNPLGNLYRVGANQYNCLFSNSVDQNLQFKLTYYFGVTPPLAVPAAVQGVQCHSNPFVLDSPAQPRLDLISNMFALWSPNDPRFYDNDNDGVIDVHDRIIDNTNISDVEVYIPLEWYREPPQAQPENSGDEPDENILGYILIPFVHSENHPTLPLHSYCPGTAEYNSSNQLFRELGFMNGVETEGLYIGRRSAQQFVDSAGETIDMPLNNILINETQLKSIWFYFDVNGNPQIPNENNLRNLTTYFYWPIGADPYQPLGRDLYQVVNGNLNSGAAPTHDKKIGCIPKSL